MSRALNVYVDRNPNGHYIIHSRRRFKRPYWLYARVFTNFRDAQAQAALFRAPNGSSLYRPEDWTQVRAA